VSVGRGMLKLLKFVVVSCVDSLDLHVHVQRRSVNLSVRLPLDGVEKTLDRCLFVFCPV
jgi:hypothetical protein